MSRGDHSGPTPHRRRFSWRRAAVGLGAGLLGGLGVSLILTQSGRIEVSAFWAMAVWPAIFGAVWGGVPTPRRLDLVLRWLIIGTAVVSLLLGARPVLAQEESCTLVMSSTSESMLGGSTAPAGERVRASDTDSSSPWTVRSEVGETFDFEIGLGTLMRGTAELRLSTVLPANPFSPEGTVLWVGNVVGDTVSGSVRVTEMSPTSITLESNGVLTRSLPIGTLGFSGVVTDEQGETVCTTEIWVRIVDQPYTSVTGLVGAMAAVIGAAGLVALSLTTPPFPPPPPPPIPARGPHSERVKCRISDESGKPVPTDQSLKPNTQYRLEVRLTLGMSEDDEEGARAERIELHPFGRTFNFDRPRLTLDLSGPGVPVEVVSLRTPSSNGRFPLHLATLHNGHLLELETLEIPVGDVLDRVQVTTTRVSTSDFSSSDLESRTPRAAQVLVLNAADDSVDIEVLDTAGERLLTYDTPYRAEALLNVARRARERLTEILEGSANHAGLGLGLDVAMGDLDRALPLLAEAGASLYEPLFGRGRLRDSARDERLADILSHGAIIQFNVDQAGIGVSTIPWGLVYDRPLFFSSDSSVCPVFASHGEDDCPNAEDASIVCPWGFWGFRYVLEHPPAWSSAAVAPPLPNSITNQRPLTVSFTSDPSFPSRDGHRQRLEAAGELDVAEIETLGELQRVWTSRPEGFDLVHFFTHHVLDPGTGAPALILGGEYLTEIHFSALNLKWPHHPLVVLAGCSSGVAHSLSAPSSLISAFRLAGASGVVGTECTVRDSVADGLMGAFLEDLFAGKAVGPSLLAMRQHALREGNSPAGLAYSLFALSDLHFLDTAGEHG